MEQRGQTFESRDLESSFLVCRWYVFGKSRSTSYI